VKRQADSPFAFYERKPPSVQTKNLSTDWHEEGEKCIFVLLLDSLSVTPAKAGPRGTVITHFVWIPAFAGMTDRESTILDFGTVLLERIKNGFGQHFRHPRAGGGLEDRCSHLL